jgi:hypothetical protein
MATKIERILDLKPWQAYERAMFNDLYYTFRGPEYVVQPDVKDVVGKLSLSKRQMDVAVFCAENPERLFLLVECKRHGRRLDVNDVGEFITKVEDTGAEHGVLVCPQGFSQPAQNLAKAKGIWLHRLTLQSADRLNWREVARVVYPWDEIFHIQMGDALHTIEHATDTEKWVESLEELAFEEWDATIKGLYQISPKRCDKLLRAIAQAHYDDAWRFNAVRLLEELGCLDVNFRDNLTEYETDPDVLDLLESAR